MSNTIVVVGFGPGVSSAVARKFGAQGFSVALVGRNHDRLAAGVADLERLGVRAAPFQADAGDPAAIRTAIAAARIALGSITVLHWNAFGGAEVGDLAAASPWAVRSVFDVAVVGLLAGVQEALDDLKIEGKGAVLVTNGAFGELNPSIDKMATMLKLGGVALANAAKAKLVGLLAERLTGDGVYVGEVTIAGSVAGTPTDASGAIDPTRIAEAFWKLYQARAEVRSRVS